MSDLDSFLEATWGNILSRDDLRIRAAFLSLSEVDRRVVKDHLQKMIKDEGWHPEQVISAQIALQAIKRGRRKRHGS